MATRGSDTAESQASDDMRLRFLQTQINYVTSLLQIADAKAAGVIAYISILSGHTTSKISLSAGSPYDLATWLGLIGGAIGLVAFAAAFSAVVPRSWSGANPRDAFSWVGLSAAASADPYPSRLSQLTPRDMQHARADAVETGSLIIKQEYRFLGISIHTALASTALQVSSWLVA